MGWLRSSARCEARKRVSVHPQAGWLWVGGCLKAEKEKCQLLTCASSLPVKSKKKRELRITCVPIKQPVANTT